MSSSHFRSGSARSPQDILGGLFLILLSLFALYLVKDLPASGRVGFASGTAPRIFAYALMALGAIIMVAGWLKEGPSLEKMSWRGPVTILGSVLFFAFAIRTFGLAVTGVPMVLLATAAAPGYNWKEAILFAVGITIFCGLLFPYALGQPIPLWPASRAEILADLTSIPLAITQALNAILLGLKISVPLNPTYVMIGVLAVVALIALRVLKNTQKNTGA